MLLTDQYLGRTSLEGVSKTLQSGDSVNYPPEELAGMGARMSTKQEDEALFQKWDEDGARFRRQLKQCAIGILILAAGAMIAWWAAA